MAIVACRDRKKGNSCWHVIISYHNCFDTNLSGPETCLIKENDLVDGLRVLVKLEGHFHPGKIQAISPPDIYGVLVDKERGNKPHIFSREEVLQEAVRYYIVDLSISISLIFLIANKSQPLNLVIK